MLTGLDIRWSFASLLLLMSPVLSLNFTDDSTYNSTDGSFGLDPILRFRPSFACSLPIQILMIGIVLTLTSVLLIHLVFTAQYHWPLAPVNYALQLSAVITLLVSLIATLHVVLNTATQESRIWPYMLTYIAVDIPPLQDQDSTAGWRTGELAAWLLMNATTSALIQITHIQFLTLLFPSNLERRLIFVLLGPLAIVAAVMQLVPLNDSSTDGKLTSIAYAVQNVCNATLSLLFTASLFIWGFLVNRKSAWRTDGGTAAFGVGALMLALASTAITFIYIPSKDHYSWMPGLMWAVILWQSFLGWWWWVGSGMGVGEVDELLRREEKRRRKRKARLAARKMRREKAQTLWRGVTGAFGYDAEKRRTMSMSGSIVANQESAGEDPRSGTRRSSTMDSTDATAGLSSRASTTTTTTSEAFMRRVQQYYIIRHIYAAYLRLRSAHLTASREQAEENSERIQQVYGPGEHGGDINPGSVGWGLGSFGVRQMGREDTQQRQEGLRGILEAEVEEEDRVSDDSSSVDSHAEPKTEADFQGQPGNARRRKNRLARRDTDARSEGTLPQHTRDSEAQPRSVWYWGPLRRWRLRDSTVYT